MRSSAVDLSLSRSRRDLRRPAVPAPSGRPGGASGAELLDHAYQTAFFLHRDRAIALDVATRALGRLEVAATSQDRRLRYEPRRPSRARNRISYGERHLLQQLVFAESEPHERRRERDGAAPMSEAEGVVFFVKHLVRIASRRNSFYATLGLARVLHDYSTPEARALYETVVQDPDRVKEDDYWRAAKKRLMAELESRFRARLRVLRTPRGEERFATLPRSERLAATVDEALAVFTPWDSDCPIPPRFDPRVEDLPDLVSPDPGEEADVELRRVHAVVHPSCWRRLTAALGLEAPARRLCVPDLGTAPGPDDGARPRAWEPAEEAVLATDDRDAVAGSLHADARRRRGIVPGTLLVMVDGEARRRWSLDEAVRIDLQVEARASWLDVVVEDGARELPLFSCALPADPEESGLDRLRRSLVAEGGQQVSLDAAFGHGSWRIELAFTETRLARRARRAVRRAARRLASPAILATPALAGALAAALAATVLWRAAGGGVAPARDAAPQAPPSAKPVSPAAPPAPERPGEAPASANGSRSAPGPGPSAAVPRLRAQDPVVIGSLASLATVKTLLLEVRGDESSGAVMLRAALAARFESSGRFHVTENADEADAALKVTIAASGPPPGIDVSVRCVSRDGRTLWPVGRDLRDRGSVEEVARRTVQRLQDAVARTGAQSGSPRSETPAQ
jgi:hypothetical protein